MEYNLSYQITINFKLTNDEFELLTEAMQNHSDCKGSTLLGEFWYGNMNRYRWNKDQKCSEPYEYYSATTRQMDTKVIKALEPFVNYNIGDKKRQQMGQTLYFNLMKVLGEAITHSNVLHAAQQPQEEKVSN